MAPVGLCVVLVGAHKTGGFGDRSLAPASQRLGCRQASVCVVVGHKHTMVG